MAWETGLLSQHPQLDVVAGAVSLGRRGTCCLFSRSGMTVTGLLFSRAQRYLTNPADQGDRWLAASCSPHFIAEDGDEEGFLAVPHQIPSRGRSETSSLSPCSPAEPSPFPSPNLSRGLTQQNARQKTRNPKAFLFTDVREAGLYPRGERWAPIQDRPQGWSSLAAAGRLGGSAKLPTVPKEKALRGKTLW